MGKTSPLGINQQRIWMIPSCHPDPINLYPETPCNPHRALTYSVTPQETVLVRHFTRSTFVCHTELFLPGYRVTALPDRVGRVRAPQTSVFLCMEQSLEFSRPSVTATPAVLPPCLSRRPSVPPEPCRPSFVPAGAKSELPRETSDIVSFIIPIQENDAWNSSMRF
jgi:hypothetical protein